MIAHLRASWTGGYAYEQKKRDKRHKGFYTAFCRFLYLFQPGRPPSPLRAISPKSSAFPPASLTQPRINFPNHLTAPIVFYSDNMTESIKAVETARGWRYKNVTLLDFPGAMNISLDELPTTMTEIPRDKFVVVHCKTGVCGEMAHLLLREKGYDVRYLQAGCRCKSDGAYMIWEM